jgi:hypothetical protein
MSELPQQQKLGNLGESKDERWLFAWFMWFIGNTLAENGLSSPFDSVKLLALDTLLAPPSLYREQLLFRH